MARTVSDARLDSRAARAKLSGRKKPYFRTIEAGRHLGYYKGPRGGVWLARTNEDGRYKEQRLGIADDVRDANGLDVLSFSQAQAAAREWFDAQALQKSAAAMGLTGTVRSTVEAYVETRNKRESLRQGRPIRSSAAYKLQRFVLADPAFADLELTELTAEALRKWRKQLPGASGSRRRVANDLKAALNRVPSSAAVRFAIKDGLATPPDEMADASAAEGQDVESKLLSDEEIRLLLGAIKKSGDDDLYHMCIVLAATGARFAQVRRLKVRDVQVSRTRIIMPASHKGRVGGQPRPPVPVPVGQDVIDALAPILTGRKPDQPLLERWRHVQTGVRQWKRDRRGPWLSAAELARPVRAAITAIGLPASASAYSFRHSSIVRALRVNLPVRLVAQLHDTSIQMIERNYTRFMAHALEDLARKAIVAMAPLELPDNVVSLPSRATL